MTKPEGRVRIVVQDTGEVLHEGPRAETMWEYINRVPAAQHAVGAEATIEQLERAIKCLWRKPSAPSLACQAVVEDRDPLWKIDERRFLTEALPHFQFDELDVTPNYGAIRWRYRGATVEFVINWSFNRTILTIIADDIRWDRSSYDHWETIKSTKTTPSSRLSVWSWCGVKSDSGSEVRGSRMRHGKVGEHKGRVFRSAGPKVEDLLTTIQADANAAVDRILATGYRWKASDDVLSFVDAPAAKVEDEVGLDFSNMRAMMQGLISRPVQ